MRKLRAPPPFPYGRVEKLWPGETVVILASGPSMTAADAEYVRGKARVIAINTTYKLAPWADVLYACDARWWGWHKGARDFQGQFRFALTKQSAIWGVTVLRNTGASGLEHDPTGIKNGRNSGYQAMNLAVHFGVSRIVLLGYDMCLTDGRAHWHKEHPIQIRSSYRHFRQQFETLVKPLAKVGVEVVNCSRHTALEVFPRAPLESVL